MTLLIPFLISRSHHVDNKVPFKLTTQDDLRVPITVLSAFTTPFLHISFLLYSSYRLALSNNITDTKATTRQPNALFLYPFLVFPMHLHLLFIPRYRHPRGRRYYTKPRLADMYIRLSSCSSRRASSVHQYRSGQLVRSSISSLSSSFSLTHMPFSTRRSSGGTAVHTISADFHHLLFFCHPLSLLVHPSVLDDTFTLAAPILDRSLSFG